MNLQEILRKKQNKPPSEPVKATPLEILLILYLRADRATVYVDYMEGYNLLRTWLSPLALPEHTTEPYLSLLVGWELQEIARTTGCSEPTLQQEIIRLYKAYPSI